MQVSLCVAALSGESDEDRTQESSSSPLALTEDKLGERRAVQLRISAKGTWKNMRRQEQVVDTEGTHHPSG